MAGELRGDEGCMAMLESLSREEILEFLSHGLCRRCDEVLQTRVRCLAKRKLGNMYISSDDITTDREGYGKKSNSRPIWRSKNASESVSHSRRNAFVSNVSTMPVDRKRSSSRYLKHEVWPDDELNWTSSKIDDGLSKEQERIRFARVGREKDFAYIERIWPDDGLNWTSSKIDDSLSKEQERIRFAQVGREKDFAYMERIWPDEGLNCTSSKIDDGLSKEQERIRFAQVGREKGSAYIERIWPDDGLNWTSLKIDDGLSKEQERIRFAQVGREKDFALIERINGKPVNVLEGLELHTKVFNSEEQRRIVDFIFMLQHMGQNGQLRARTYSEPRKWMRGKGRVTIQFGCCYNYAVDKDGNPPGIVRDEEVDPLPSLFKQMIKRMVRWQVLPAGCVPDSCIVNIYEEGDCIPPHIDHYDFVRPFCTVSFLSECNILFGSNLKVIGPGEFDGPVSIRLPIGSVLILNGNGADVAKHCVPGVSSKRISITFRKMDPDKVPYMHVPERDLMGIKCLTSSTKFLTNLERDEHRETTRVKSSFSRERYKYKKASRIK